MEVKTEYRFKEIEKYLVGAKRNFTKIIYGNTQLISYDGHEYIMANLDEVSGKGFHISRIVKRDVLKFIEDNKITPRGHDYLEQMFNLDAIEKNIGKPISAIDVKDCYWTTIHKLGYITDKTYTAGLRKSEWKDGRNASIGSLATVKYVSEYINGKQSKKGFQPLRPRDEFLYARNNVIGYVYDAFEDIRVQLGSHFMMFLTDCAFVNPARERFVREFLSGHGYTTKTHTIEFQEVDRTKKIIYWHDFDAWKDKKDHSKGKGKDKYYCYANHQVVCF